MIHLTIALVAPSFHPMIGGVELYVLNLGKQLVRRGHTVHILTPDSVMGRKLSPSEEVVDGLNVHRVKTYFDFSYRLKLWPGLRNMIRYLSPQIVHVYSHDSYSYFALAGCRDVEIPMLLTTYGPFKIQTESGYLASVFLGMYDSWITPRLVRGADSINIRYPELESWLLKLGVMEDQITLEPSCIPSQYLEPGNPKSFSVRSGITSRFVLYVGRISRQKGIHHLLIAARRVHDTLPDIEFVLVGPNYSRMDFGSLPDWIHVLPPPTTLQEERDLFSGCEVFVMPSKYEGFSQAVMKALAQGRRVVASQVGGLPFELGYGRYGKLVPYGDTMELARGIVESLNNHPAETEQKLKEYSSNFTFEICSSRIESQYLRLSQAAA